MTVSFKTAPTWSTTLADMAAKTTTNGPAGLLALANVGPAVARHFERVGITGVDQLAGGDAVALYERMCAIEGSRLDRCLLDTILSAVDQANGAPARPWWHYTAERKRQGR